MGPEKHGGPACHGGRDPCEWRPLFRFHQRDGNKDAGAQKWCERAREATGEAAAAAHADAERGNASRRQGLQQMTSHARTQAKPNNQDKLLIFTCSSTSRPIVCSRFPNFPQRMSRPCSVGCIAPRLVGIEGIKGMVGSLLTIPHFA